LSVVKSPQDSRVGIKVENGLSGAGNGAFQLRKRANLR
jgi:hypothetical protein